MSAAALAEPQAHPQSQSIPQPCGRTQNKLDDLLQKTNYNVQSPAFSMYFTTDPSDLNPRTHEPSNIPRCLECGCTIGEHLNATANAPVSLADVDRVFDERTKTLYDDTVFDDRSATDVSVSKSKILDTGTSCWVCGIHPDNCVQLSRAHVIPHRAALLKLGLSGCGSANFIVLCGTKGENGTCHDLFDHHEMSFVHKPTLVGQVEDMTKWTVVGGGDKKHVDGGNICGRQVTLPSRPHRRAIYSHLKHALIHAKLKKPTSNAEASDYIKQEAASDDDDALSRQLSDSPPSPVPDEDQ